MAMLQLNPMLPVHVVGKGDGYAFLVIDYSQEHHAVWAVTMNKGGEIFFVKNPDIRMCVNWTMGRERDASVN
jgi:hypothetical protein